MQTRQILYLESHGHEGVGLGLNLGHAGDGLHRREEVSLGGELLLGLRRHIGWSD